MSAGDRRVRIVVVACALLAAGIEKAAASEIWVAPTYQADGGGLGIGSNGVWPVTPIGAVRLAWAVPGDLQTFTGARLVLIPHAPGGAATLNLFVCAAQHGDMVAAACTGPHAQPFTGVANQLVEVEVSAAVAPQVGVAGANHLALVAYTSPTIFTDHIVGLRFIYDAAPPAGAATLGANTFTGTQTAPAFVGDGSGLTGVPLPAGAATLGSNVFTGTQTAPAFVGDGSGLTNLPFPAGVATLGANTFVGTQTIDGANLDLDPSTSTTGNVLKNGTRFLHDFGNQNIFLGMEAGNFTTTGHTTTAVGFIALRSNTTGNSNTALGHSALAANTTGAGNVATGAAALASNTTGGGNAAVGVNALADNVDGSRVVAVGHSALRHNTSGVSNTATGVSALHFTTIGNRNTAVGDDALRNNTTGSRNVAVGWNAGLNATTGVQNIYLGTDVVGEAGESNTMYLGKVGTHAKTIIAGVRGTSLVGGEMVLVDADGRLGSGPVAPGDNTIGSDAVIDNSLTASDLAPDSVGTSEVAFNYAASASEAGAASDVACAGCIGPAEVSFSFATPNANTFTGTQAIDAGNIDLEPSTATTGSLTKNGTRFLHDFGLANTFLGLLAGNLTLTGDGNTGVGRNALQVNESGSQNTAVGAVSLAFNTSGTFNSAFGRDALRNSSTGHANTAVGFQALRDNVAGENNTATGADALEKATGTNNTAFGYAAGFSATSGSNNIYLGANVFGVAGETNTMYLGRVGTQTKSFIAGVRGITTVNPDAIQVLIDSAGQLGTISSSRRFKEDIEDMGDASARLLQLRPVTFRYTQPFAGGAKPVQYGLIAEEVAEVFPDLVVTGGDGQVETVQYQKLDAMLLNELQKLYREVQALKAEVARMKGERQP